MQGSKRKLGIVVAACRREFESDMKKRNCSEPLFPASQVYVVKVNKPSSRDGGRSPRLIACIRST